MLEFVDDVFSIDVTGRNVHVTDAMKAYAIEKVRKVERFSNKIIDIHITMDIQKLEHRVEITMHANHIKIKSHGISNDMYVSVDMAVDRIEKQLKRYLSRLHDHQARQYAIEEVPVDVIKAPSEQDILDEINDEIESWKEQGRPNAFAPHAVVHKETKPVKTLTTDEAVMKMELSGDAFLVYRSEENRKVQVIYRRGDGNYGIIQPETR